MNLSFARLEEGYENALKDYYKKQVPSLFIRKDVLSGNIDCTRHGSTLLDI